MLFRSDGGLALGTTVTSMIFLGAILAVVVFLTITKKDQTLTVPPEFESEMDADGVRA